MGGRAAMAVIRSGMRPRSRCWHAVFAPSGGLWRCPSEDSVRDLPHRLTSVPHIDDLYRPWKVLLGQVPNPGGAITQDDDLLGGRQSLLTGTVVEEGTKLFGTTAPGDVDLLIGGIHQHPWHQRGAVWPACRHKHCPHLDLAIDIPFALFFFPLHWHASPAQTCGHAIRFHIQALEFPAASELLLPARGCALLRLLPTVSASRVPLAQAAPALRVQSRSTLAAPTSATETAGLSVSAASSSVNE